MPTAGEHRITDEHIAQLREEGFALVHNFLTEDELAASRADCAQLFPTAAQYADERATSEEEPRAHYSMNLPYNDAPFLSRLAVHPEIVSYVERVLESDDVLITQALLMAKYPGGGDRFEQAFHTDHRNNMLVTPREDGDFRVVQMILYFDDVTEENGATGVLPYSLTSGMLGRSITRESDPDIFAHEVRAAMPAGSMLLYSMHTFHRGTAYTAETGARFSQHLVYKAARHHWINWSPWAVESAKPGFVRLMEECTPRERALFGFPKPGDDYWTAETLADVKGRYPNMDLTPYEELVGTSGRDRGALRHAG